MTKRTLHIGAFATAVAAALAVAAAAGSDVSRTAAAMPPPASFTTRIDNPWFPLRPGTQYIYTGEKDGTPARDILTVTRQTVRIDGVRCVVVHDRLYLRGRLGERTTDWYSQDATGNVWYLGEDTAELDSHGRVTSTQGSWRAGTDGARAGIYMPANPRLGASGRQEYYKGQAEDHFKVIGLFGSDATKNALLTEEWTPLEPGTIDHKLYVRGVGTVLEQTERGGSERAELVSVKTTR
jgi:hypothetical protein